MMQQKIVPDIVPRRDIASVTPDDSVLTAAATMAEINIAALVIVDGDGALIGIVTERDVTQRLVAKGLDASATPVSEIMTVNPDTLSPDDSAGDALELMQSRKYRHLPVAEDGKCIGMVSIRDLYAPTVQNVNLGLRLARGITR